MAGMPSHPFPLLCSQLLVVNRCNAEPASPFFKLNPVIRATRDKQYVCERERKSGRWSERERHGERDMEREFWGRDGGMFWLKDGKE